MYWQPQTNPNYTNYSHPYEYPYEFAYDTDFRQTLTGRWQCDDGGLYHIHQPSGTSEVFWLGLSDGGLGTTFTNIFVGDIRPGGIIVGRWGDIPIGNIMQHGVLRLQVENNGRQLRALQKTGGFGGSIWTKQ
ncbi:MULTISPECIES: hypothetical protein [Bacillus]|uniref:Uncharacterized protein n=3 Tax=Bacillus cereus group TaxID=86661 RepID=A0A5B9HW42_BACCE|nr:MULTISPECIES: hypothetical protein [Bacillus]EJR29773.1 hypothetical protein IIE_05013 [Bacillus cereus VD045]KAB7638675.1 hypothetical protein GBN78_29950 [Bacillus sp. B2-WWTP-C-10-Post-4]MBE4939650.1 hypothetical protein [Bacillus thuringiensis]MEB9430890.1 hypothetical protein [Bacillus cereus]MEB9481044.1 hypothetical protein [Bacillus cereus]